MVPPRAMASGDDTWRRSLTAVSPGGRAMGCNLIAASPHARCASYLISLFDAQTMGLAALIDGNRATGLRTAATAAVAVDLLAARRPQRIDVFGAGTRPRTHPPGRTDDRRAPSGALRPRHPAHRPRMTTQC